MPEDLTNSKIDRQNILNNPYAIVEIQKATQIKGIEFEGTVRLVKEQVAQFFEVTPRTIDNILQQYGDELRQNGYEVLKGKRLKEFKLRVQEQSGNEMDFVTKTTVLGSFDFRAFLNIAMLLSDMCLLQGNSYGRWKMSAIM
jgi:transcriptional antiterminator